MKENMKNIPLLMKSEYGASDRENARASSSSKREAAKIAARVDRWNAHLRETETTCLNKINQYSLSIERRLPVPIRAKVIRHNIFTQRSKRTFENSEECGDQNTGYICPDRAIAVVKARAAILSSRLY